MLEDARSPQEGPAQNPFGEDPQGQLTSEELRELLSPIGLEEDEFAENGADAILLLTERPEDAEIISVFMKPHDIRVIPAAERYRALDLFRQRQYRAFVSTPNAWGDDADGYLERLHAVDPRVRLVFICDAHELPGIPRSERVDRPLTPEALQPLLGPAGITVGDSFPEGGGSGDRSAEDPGAEHPSTEYPRPCRSLQNEVPVDMPWSS